MLENIILGTVQGIAEWLPVSSEGLIILTKTKFFPATLSFEGTVRLALFLHLGTFLAALIYFRQDVCQLIKSLFQYSSQTPAVQKTLSFLIVTTLISGTLGLILLKSLSHILDQLEASGRIITLLIGGLLLITAYLELKASDKGYKTADDLKVMDYILLGIAQGCAALPGLSRSGLTVSALLLRKFDKTCALKLSFLMSLPIVLGGNIILHLDAWSLSPEALGGLFFSFLFGLATIHGLLKIAQKMNFGYFLLLFGALTFLSAFFTA